MDLPGHGVVQGEWDLRPNLSHYFGGVDFRGKRALDVGAASGCLTFAMERQGAEVIAYDLSPEYPPDIVPSFYSASLAAERRRGIESVNNSFWLAHRALDSKARLVHGSVYQMPAAIGSVDIAVLGCILLHLRDPFLALQNALGFAKERAVIVEPIWHRRRRWLMAPLKRLAGAHMTFAPTPAGWWELTPGIVQRFVAALGFEKSSVSLHRQLFKGHSVQMFTVDAERTRAQERLG